MPTLNARQMRALLDGALSVALATDASTLPVAMLYAPGHQEAAALDTTVVTAGPGAGKSLWARVLADPQLRTVAAHEFRRPRLESVRAVTVLDAAQGDGRPSTAELAALTASGIRPLTVWTAATLHALGTAELTRLPSWRERALWLERHPDAAHRAFATLAADPKENGTVHVLVFDALDRLHPDQRRADLHASAILQLAADLARWRPYVRPKVFIRRDMLTAALPALASRRTLRTTRLDWSTHNARTGECGTLLYGLLFHLLGNHTGEDAATFRALTPGWSRTPDGRHTAPEQLNSDPKAQEQLFSLLADPYRGATRRHGTTYSMLPAHLLDTSGALSPRPFLAALHRAVRHTAAERPNHDRALHHEDIQRGVLAGADTRAHEVEQSMPWVRAVLEPLAGRQLPIDLDQAVTLWDSSGLPEQLRLLGHRSPDPAPSGLRHLERYADLLDELAMAGVARKRGERLDLAEVFRLAHRLGRHGGVRRTSTSQEADRS